MGGRKAVKGVSGKNRQAAGSLARLTTKRLKKLRKTPPANRLDLQKCTTFKTLHLQSHRKDTTKLLRDLYGEDSEDLRKSLQVFKTIYDIRHPSGRYNLLELLCQLRNGLEKKRLVSLTFLGDILALHPEAVMLIGQRLLVDLCARVIDDSRNVRRHAIELIHEGILKKFIDDAAMKRFCLATRETLWLQLRLVMTHVNSHIRLDGTLFLFKLLCSCPSVTFQDRTFIFEILPLLLRRLRKAAFKSGTKKGERTLTPIDGHLRPLCSEWTSIVCVSVSLALFHLSEAQQLQEGVKKQLPFDIFKDSVGCGIRPCTDFDESQRREGPLVFLIADCAIDLSRMIFGLNDRDTSAVVNSSVQELEVAPRLLHLCISLLHWCQEIFLLSANEEADRLNLVPSTLQGSKMSKGLCDCLLSNPKTKERVDLYYWFKHGRYLKFLEELIYHVNVTLREHMPAASVLERLNESISILIHSLCLNDTVPSKCKQLRHLIENTPESVNLNCVTKKLMLSTEVTTVSKQPSPVTTFLRSMRAAYGEDVFNLLGVRVPRLKDSIPALSECLWLLNTVPDLICIQPAPSEARDTLNVSTMKNIFEVLIEE